MLSPPPKVAKLTGEARMRTPVVSRSIPWFVQVHLGWITHTRISDTELLQSSTDFDVLDTAIAVAIKRIEEPLGFVRSHLVVECCKKTHDLRNADSSRESNLPPHTLEFGFTFGRPHGLEVHVGTQLATEHGVSAREATRR